MHKLGICSVILAAIAASSTPARAQRVAADEDGIAARRMELLTKEADHPFPGEVCVQPADLSDVCFSAELSRATALLYIDRSPDDLSLGNSLAADVARRIPHLKGFGAPGGLPHIDKDGFHFDIGSQLYRIEAQFGRENGQARQAANQPPMSGHETDFRGRLDAGTSHAIAQIFYDWARISCPIKDADPGTVWNIYGTENHEAMMNAACWGAAEMLARQPEFRARPYGDGS
ncbi:MAG: hypothetical protein JOZ22_13070, partial [Acidobacteriia bacterium]|nr:hypothetical protein [Terriglobia bacterium]